jgi:hypothetical protein
MQADEFHTAPMVEELLELLADALPDAEKPAFERRASTIRKLLTTAPDFSVKAFVANEVASAMED